MVISQNLLQDLNRNGRVAACTCNPVTLEAELLSVVIRYPIDDNSPLMGVRDM